MTSKLGRINESVRRRIATTNEPDYRIHLAALKGQSIISVMVDNLPPDQWPIITLAYRFGRVTNVGHKTFPSGPHTKDVSPADIMGWLDNVETCLYMNALGENYDK